MEAVKNRLTGFRRNAGTFVVDPDADFVANAPGSYLDQPAWRREADRIVDDCVDRPREPVGLTHHDGAVLARTGESQARITGFAPGFPAPYQLLDQRPQVDSLEGRAGQFGVGS